MTTTLNTFGGSGGKRISASLLDQNFAAILALIAANVPLVVYTTAEVEALRAAGGVTFGFAYSDSTLNYPRWWNGTSWNGFALT